MGTTRVLQRGIVAVGIAPLLTAWPATRPSAQPDFGFAVSAGGVGSDRGLSVASDAAGNVYTTGDFQALVDFDTGPGTANLLSEGSEDVFVAKYTAAGELVWARQLGDFAHIHRGTGHGLALDGQGNVYITGRVYIFTTLERDAFVLKLDSSGNFVWARRMGGPGNDEGTAVAVDGQGNVYTTGSFRHTVDFDPGPGTANLLALGNRADAFVLKLDSSGNFVWATKMGGSDNDWGAAVAVDGCGNVYTAGSSNPPFGRELDAFVSKLDSFGNFIWERRTGGSSPIAVGNGLALDGQGNVYATGYFYDEVDFNPGPGTANLASAGIMDAFVWKLNGGAKLVWARRMGGSGNDEGTAVAVDGQGNVYATGDFYDEGDFDPGPGTANLASAGFGDGFVLKLDSSGNFVWATRMGGSGNDEGTAVAVDGQRNVYTTGEFSSEVDFDPGPGTANLASAGLRDVFVSKLTE